MYLRTIQRKNKDGSVVRYVQLAHNTWDSERGYSVTNVIHSFGREEHLDRDALRRLIGSISRFLSPEEALEVTAGGELAFLSSRPMGGGWVLDRLWRSLGVDEAVARAAQGRRLDPRVERVVFSLVANRALRPSSKRAALEWAQDDVHIPDLPDLGAWPQVFYRAMDFLLEAADEIQREVFFSVANLLNLRVDLILFDTTSTYFETEAEDDLRRYGHSKDHRPDRPQAVVGLAVTQEGIPVRCWTFPGEASDQTLIRRVKDDLRDWRLHRVIWVADRGFSSEENRSYLQRAGGHYIVGEKLRQGRDNHQALSRPGRYREVTEGLEVKEVWVGEGARRRRFVVCRNREEAVRDRQRREAALSRLEGELEAVAERQGEARVRAEATLLTHPTFRRYLTRRGGRLEVDRAKARAEERLDGKFLLSSSDDDLTAAEVALHYKSLWEVERAWRDLKHTLDLRPVYHRLEERIRSHVLVCFLGLLLVRVAETKVGDTWARIRRELERMHLGEFSGSAGRVLQRTETTPRQREILRALQIEEPPRFFELTPTEAA